MSHLDSPAEKAQGHWLLAKMGKRVLRPGGRELTRFILDTLNIGTEDSVVEFAPGLGFTARMAVARKPQHYTAVELNPDAAELVRKRVQYPNMQVVVASAAETHLPDNYASKVYGEAMLTMQADAVKKQILAEAHRLLQPGGFYAIHEIALLPEEVDVALKTELRNALIEAIKTNVRPLTVGEWRQLLQDTGFEIVAQHQTPMHLLEIRRIIADEGFLRFLLILARILCNKSARRRILHMRNVFRRYDKNMCGIGIIARKAIVEHP